MRWYEREKEKKEADKASAFCHLQLDKLFYYNLKNFWFCRQFVSDLRRVNDTESVEYIVCTYVYVHNYYCQLVKGLTSNSSYTQHRKNKTFYFETHDWFFLLLLYCFALEIINHNVSGIWRLLWVLLLKIWQEKHWK